MLEGEWEIPLDEIQIHKNELLGKGQYGSVYKGKWRGLEVAIKIFDNDMTGFSKKELLHEFKILTQLHHPNIVQLLGYTSDPFMVIMEYFKLGNLQQFLEKHQFWLSNFHRLQLCLEIAKGIHYLHNRKPAWIIHRDIKPSNFLVDTGLRIKIADFGMSKFIQVNPSAFQPPHFILSKSNPNLPDAAILVPKSGNAGTPSYMAPEMLNEKDLFYTKSIDIYSFGIVMYEIFSRKRIFYEWSNHALFLEEVKKGIHPRFPYCFPKKIKTLILECLHKDSRKRPDSSMIVERLDDIMKDYNHSFIHIFNVYKVINKNII